MEQIQNKQAAQPFTAALSTSQLLDLYSGKELIEKFAPLLHPDHALQLDAIPTDKIDKVAVKWIKQWMNDYEKERVAAEKEQANKLIDDQLQANVIMIADWLKSHEITYVSTQRSPWVCFKSGSITNGYERSWTAYSDQELSRKFRAEKLESLESYLSVDTASMSLVDVAITAGLYCEDITSSNRNDLPVETFNRLTTEQRYWVTNSVEYMNATPDLSVGIKTLMWSLAGGKQENFDHICQSMYWKLTNKGDNTQLPALVIYGSEGVGKGIFAEHLLPTMAHGRNASCEIKADALDGFNRQLEGKAFVCLNESDGDKANSKAIKKTIGAQRINIEPKGQDSYEVDNTAMYLFFTNDPLSSVSLSQNASENRRYSIINVEHDLHHWILNNPDTKCKNNTESTAFINNVILKDCHDRQVVANFIKWVEVNYQNDRCPKALHGEDYFKLLGLQKTSKSNAAENLLQALIDSDFNMVQLDTVVTAVSNEFTRTGIKTSSPEHVKRIVLDSLQALNIEFVAKQVKANGKPYRNTLQWTQKVDENGKKAARRIAQERDIELVLLGVGGGVAVMPQPEPNTTERNNVIAPVHTPTRPRKSTEGVTF